MPYLDFKFCPLCGFDNVSESDRKTHCTKCDFTFYFNAATAVAGLIIADNQLLTVRRAREPFQGKLDLPGGFVDFDETAEHALKREIREELNLDVDNLSFLTTQPNTYLYRNITYHVVDLFFACCPLNMPAIQPTDDVDAYTLSHPRDINLDDIAFTSTRNLLERLLAGEFPILDLTL